MDMGTDTGMKNNSALTSVTAGLIVASLSSIALAQSDEQSNRSFVIRPRVALTETWSDNVSLRSSQNGKESGLITELAPGIRIDANTARLKAYFDYTLIGQFYSTSSGNSQTRNSLNSFGTLEAISNWLFLDFSGVIAQQAISAFGTQSPSGAYSNNNSTETSTYRLSPYIRGQIAGNVDYSLRYSWSTTQSNASNASTVSSIDTSDWAGQLRGGTPFQSLKWSVDVTQQDATYSLGRATDAKRLYGTGTYIVVPQFRISLSGGSESNNYASQDMVTHPTYGYGFDWTPTERTQISAFKEHRFFGDGHRYSFSHRFPLSSIRYSDTKDVSVLPNQFSSVGMGTIYDMFNQYCNQQLSSSISNPNQLTQAANACAAYFVNRSGISPNTQVISSFLSSRATIQRSQQLALAFVGSQNTVTIQFNRNENQSILAADATNNIPLQNDPNSIIQRGFSVNFSHTLSAVSNFNVMASRQKSTGSGSSIPNATTSMYQANITSKLGARTNGGITIRHTEFDNTISPYTENAIVGTVSVIF
jgi:uncharacterized protein (PEP-CTERM system associated)